MALDKRRDGLFPFQKKSWLRIETITISWRNVKKRNMLVCINCGDLEFTRAKKSNSKNAVNEPRIIEININPRASYFSGRTVSSLLVVSEEMVMSGTSVIKLVNSSCTGSKGKLRANKYKKAKAKKLPKLPTRVYLRYLLILTKMALPS